MFSRAEFFEVEMARAGPRAVAYRAPMRLEWVGKTQKQKAIVIVRKTGVPAVFFVAALALVLLLIVAREDRE
jgi:fumarate reductase subunit C